MLKVSQHLKWLVEPATYLRSPLLSSLAADDTPFLEAPAACYGQGEKICPKFDGLNKLNMPLGAVVKQH